MPLPRRLRSFSLRTLMVLVGVCALVAAWVARERAFVLERRAARAQLGTHLAFFSPAEVERGERLCPTGGPRSIPATVPRIRELLGDEPVQAIWLSGKVEEFRVARLFPEATLVRP